jgi:predicted DNA-binding antitoxin AbrB/MazE fold protein
MVYRGHVENGVIQLEGSVVLPEGSEVRVEVVPPPSCPETEAGGLTLYERLKPVIGAVTDLPEDFAQNHDHYLHGLPKQ